MVIPHFSHRVGVINTAIRDEPEAHYQPQVIAEFFHDLFLAEIVPLVLNYDLWYLKREQAVLLFLMVLAIAHTYVQQGQLFVVLLSLELNEVRPLGGRTAVFPRSTGQGNHHCLEYRREGHLLSRSNRSTNHHQYRS